MLPWTGTMESCEGILAERMMHCFLRRYSCEGNDAPCKESDNAPFSGDSTYCLAKSQRTKNLAKRRETLFLAKMWHTTALGSSRYNLFRSIFPSFFIFIRISLTFKSCRGMVLIFRQIIYFSKSLWGFLQVPQRPGFNVSPDIFFPNPIEDFLFIIVYIVYT